MAPVPLRVLFLEDCPSDHELTLRALRKDGLEVEDLRVETREDFSRALKDFGPDLVVSDYSLPAFDGLQALAISLKVDAELPFILLTGSVNETTAVDCLKAGATDYVLKDHLGRLSHAVREALEQRDARRARAASEEALRQRTAELDHYFNHSTEFLAIFDLKGHVRRLNPMWAGLLGVSVEELAGRSVVAYTHPSDFEGMRQALHDLLAGVPRVTGSARARAADGSWRCMEWSGTRQADLIYVVAHDVTEQRRVQLELTRARLTYEGILGSVTEAVYIQDGQGVFLEVNQAVLEMYGYPREAFIGRTPEFLSAPGRNDMATAMEKIRLAFEGQPQRLEFWGLRANGEEFPKEVSLTRGDWFGQPVVIAVARDISARCRMEEELDAGRRDLDEITRVLAARGGDYFDNVREITALAGRQLQADAALYNRLEDGRLRAIGRWNTPEDFPYEDLPQGHLCADVIAGVAGDVLVVPDLAASSYADSDPNVRRYDLAGYVGRVVHAPDGRAVGSLCVVYGQRHEPTDRELSLLALLGRAMESEEARRSSEEALRQSERFMRAVLDSSPLGISVRASDGRLLSSNEAWRRIWAIPDEAVRNEMTRPRQGLVMDEDDEYCRPWWDEIRRIYRVGGTLVIPAVPARNPRAGSAEWISQVFYAIPDEQGRVDRIVVITQDISEHKRAEEALRQSEQFMRAVLDSSPLGISVRSRDGRLLSSNEAWRRIWAIPDVAVQEDMEKPREELRLDERDDYSLPWWQEIRRVYREGGRLAIPEVRTLGRRAGSAEWISQFFYAIPDDRGAVDRIVVITQDISERKQAEEALRLSERRLADAVEMARLGHWEYDPVADLFNFNDQFYKVLRTTAAEAGGYSMSLLDYQSRFLHPDESHTVADENLRARAADSADFTSQVEQHVRFADGEEGWISVRTFLQKDEDGRTVRTYGVIQDVTERRMTEERLRESGRMLEEAQQVARLGSYSMNTVSGQWQSSTILDGIFGIPATGFTRDVAGWLAIVHPEEREEMLAYFQTEVLGQRHDFDRQYRIVRQNDGETRWLHGRGALTIDGEGRVTRMVGMIQDITERHQAEEALRQSEAHYRQFFEHDLTADYISTTSGQLLDCNPAYLRLFGFSNREEALATNVSGLYPDAVARHALLEQLLKHGRLEYQEIELRDLEGRPLFVIMNVLGSFDAEGRLERMQGYLFDITQHKQLQQQFYQAQKMESIGRLAGGVAHDFNNLLTVINGHVDLMRAQVLPQDPLREQMEQIAAAGERAARLTRQLLAFSRRQVLQMEPVALNLVINDLGKMLQRLIGEDIRLETRLEKTLPAVMADAGQLEQVVVNLAVNSRDAMPDGGTLTLSTQSMHVDEEFCRLHRPQTPGHYCLMEVSDTGVGMSEDVQSRVFEPFFTTKEKGRGTGLGLATVYGIIKQVGGYIWLQSEPGLGTTFQIFLPVVQAEVERRDSRGASGQLLKGSETVLVVEDEEMVRRLAVRMLKSQGYQVLEACHGREALAVLEANPETKLVLTDVIMPVMGGRELAVSLRARPCPPEVIFMSGYTEEDIARQGLVQAGLHFIQKPFDMLTMLQKVRVVLDGH